LQRRNTKVTVWFSATSLGLTYGGRQVMLSLRNS
jgi:hypothetical protein